MENTLVLDLETTMRCPVGNNSANPMWLGNKIIAAGWNLNDNTETIYDSKGMCAKQLIELCKDNLVVGHNIKFDLLYIYRNTSNVLPSIWCTQLAAYILSGQRQLYASLDELTAEYIGAHALKDDKIKAYWKSGVATEDIPKSELITYLIGDVDNTTKIYEQQLIESEQLGIMPLMRTQMDALRATTEMNRNGMCVDWTYVDGMRKHYGEIINTTATKINALVSGLDYLSPKKLALYYFGGVTKDKERVPDGVYKNGNPKLKTIEIEVQHIGKYKPFTEVGKSGYYSVDDATLKELQNQGDELATSLLVMRNAQKIKETYYEGLNTLRFPDGNIYPNLNHCATKTGRLSSTNPNLQNQTEEGDVKKAYISRYGSDGSILELDYAQLEMVALAYLADDKQLIEDINNGRDMHRELYKGMYGRYPTDKERKPFKRYSFLLVYGGGVTTLMAQSGCDRATATKFIKTFYTRYKGVKKYHEQIVKDAEQKAIVSYDPKKAGPQYHYYHASPTGRHYVFNKYNNEYKGGLSFSPTELKNHPIQGFATGDVVPMMVGILLRKLDIFSISGQERPLLVMTVHDSVVLDIPSKLVYKVARVCKDTLENAPKYMKEFFNIDFPCTLGVGVDVGVNWQDSVTLKEFK